MSEMTEGEVTAKDPNTLKILSDHGILHLVISREGDKSFIKKCHVTCVPIQGGLNRLVRIATGTDPTSSSDPSKVCARKKKVELDQWR